MALGDVVRVTWEDPVFDMHDPDPDIPIVHTYGVLIRADKDFVVVAGEELSYGQMRGMTKVHRKLVVDIDILEERNEEE